MARKLKTAEQAIADVTVTVDAPVKKTRAKKTVAPVEPEVVTLTEEQADALLDGGAVDLVTVVKETKRRVQSRAERDEAGKVKRQGKNLSGNQPFRRKYYYYDLDVVGTEGYDKALAAAPAQVRLIMNYMRDEGITTPEDAAVGSDIAGGAINSGALKSKIDPAALFAYYRRVMERLGLTLGVEG